MMKQTNELVIVPSNKNEGYKLKSDREHLIINDGELFNPFKNEYYDLYLLSNEKILKGDWYIDILTNNIYQSKDDKVTMECFKKIIASTNITLNLLYIPLLFVELYATEYNKHNNKIIKVEVEYWEHTEHEPQLKLNPDNTINISLCEEYKSKFTNLKTCFMNSSNTNHIKWIYERMIHVHKENPNYDYMIKLKEISDWVDENSK